MKKQLLMWGFASVLANAQAPAGYYNSANGLSGASLKTALSSIITNGHQDKGYNALWTGFKITDIDKNYENDGSILDIYSENPTGADPYNFIPVTNQCGTYTEEGNCYNREHIIPQSLFNSASPMYSDINFIRATDGKVNAMRADYPFGIVGTATSLSSNGSKLGSSASPGYSGIVFEPVNEFKGDIARMIFYFVTRYQSKLATFSSGDILGNSAFPGLQSWELNVLLAWHNQDPVSQAEINRNNASYAYQGNRNPFIDNPNYVNQIWAPADTQAPTTVTGLSISGTTSSSISLSWNASTDNVGVTSYNVYMNGNLQATVSSISATISGLSPSTTYPFYIVAKDVAGNSSPNSSTVSGTTNAPIDTQAPFTVTGLAVTGTSPSSISLSWNASADNVGVTSYDVYMNGNLKTSVSVTSATISGLNASTTYTFNVIAKDAAGNSSANSSTVSGTTDAVPPPTNCVYENFENIPAGTTGYLTRTWTNNGITWIATDARTDQTISNKAITIRDGSLTSSSSANGIGSLTVTTQLKFTGSNGTFTVKVNGTDVGTIPYNISAATTTISNINISGNVVVTLENNSTTNRVAIDDLSWTCYSGMAKQVQSFSTETISDQNTLQVSPNPVSNNEIFVKGETQNIKKAEIYNLHGKVMQTIDQPFKNSKNSIKIKNLEQGIYILKLDASSLKFIVK
ncbi:endonuclease [Chryseobacterium sp. SL1]|uniref:endonuclease n=1 Tax=Chryseobacterium sp. SL1 TaxID=2995159 RepID=UPI002274BFED|nr:endonuclease [Chryseobacterium sp. SL1]MCY1662856.1 endonuclease [Chryseobacterium sp. SL1]